MLHYTKEDLLELGAEITTREIYQQPDVWREAFEFYQAKREEIAAFLQEIADKHDYIKVILTGAGTSAYVGDTLLPYFKEVYDERKWNFNAIATTDIVANPATYLKKDVATILVSFARSGNSPESVATVDLAKSREALITREKSFPTGLDMEFLGKDLPNVAIPHTDIVHNLAEKVVVVRLEKPVTFHNMIAPDKEVEVSLLFFIINNSSSSQTNILAQLMDFFTGNGHLEDLSKISEPEKLYAYIAEATA
ncbi:tagatose-6-phosphate ketose/aldose isomerase [Streptococcus pneumoniae]|nr:tagatose-6-phosphate ketose/aldose isomerase [Streptococcus pneumoniae]